MGRNKKRVGLVGCLTMLGMMPLGVTCGRCCFILVATGSSLLAWLCALRLWAKVFLGRRKTCAMVRESAS